MSNKYQFLVIPIYTNGELNLNSLSLMEKQILENRDVIYIYSGLKNIYIGQTICFTNRHASHLSNRRNKSTVNKYNEVIVLYGKLIDKNLDYLEKQLITLFVTDNSSGRNKKIIDNKSPGISSNHIEDSKELDALVIRPFWEKDLFTLGYVRNQKVTFLKRKILSKYSPFMNLTEQQQNIIETIIENDKNQISNNYLIEGGSGTGKTVMMTNIVAQLFDEFKGTKKIGVVVKANWRRNANNIFKNYEMNKNVIVDTWGAIKDYKNKFDYIIVDESHRLPYWYGKLHPSERKYFNGNKNKNSLELLGEKTNSLILLYDQNQSIRPSDIPTDEYLKYISKNNFIKYYLNTQFRIDIHDKNKTYTSDDYLKGIRYVLQLSDDSNFDKSLFSNTDLDSYFGFVDSIEELFEYITRMDNLIENSQNRVIAGYSREWVSKNDSSKYDWNEKGKEWRWNSTHEDWMNKENSRNEIGSIHAVQGVDINCVGLIIGKDLSFKNGKVVASKENYFDRNGIPIKNQFIDSEFNDFIKNIYYVLMTRGIDGIRVYIEDKELKNHFYKTLLI